MKQVKVQLNYLRIAPRKVRLVANLLKGMEATHALMQLKFLQKRSSMPIAKLLQSAIAGARNNFELKIEDLYIKEIIVNPGPVLKRFRPRAMGRAAKIRKRTSHVSLLLETKDNSIDL